MPRQVWLFLTLASIVFEAGIAGSWLGEQMRAPLPQAWGWLGASISGLALFGGVNLAVRGQKIGWAIVLVAASASVVFSWHYFGDKHGYFVSGVLGGFPPFLSVLAGLVESQAETITEKNEDQKYERQERARIQAEERTRAAQAEQEARQLAHELHLAKIAAAKEAKLAEIEASTKPAHASMNLHSAGMMLAQEQMMPAQSQHSASIPCPYAEYGCSFNGKTIQSVNAHMRFCQHKPELNGHAL